MVTLLDNVEKHRTARQATDENVMRGKHFACWITTGYRHSLRIF